MKTSKVETAITISRVINKFVWKMDISEDAKEKRKKDKKVIQKKIKWNLNISIMMLLYCNNWKIIASKQVWIMDANQTSYDKLQSWI
jgi:hypothetical protein